MAYLKIDGNALKSYVHSQGMKLIDASEKIGRSRNFLSGVCGKGTMLDSAHKLLCETFGLPADSFLIREPGPAAESQKQKSDMYWIDLNYSHDRLKVQVMFGDDVIVGANAYIKGESQLDFVKAISYAAHMCYKFAEQTTLEK